MRSKILLLCFLIGWGNWLFAAKPSVDSIQVSSINKKAQNPDFVHVYLLDVSPGKAYYSIFGRVDINFRFAVEQARGDGGLDDQLDHIAADGFQLRLGRVLRGDDHGVDALGLAGFVVFDRDFVGVVPTLVTVGKCAVEAFGGKHPLREEAREGFVELDES